MVDNPSPSHLFRHAEHMIEKHRDELEELGRFRQKAHMKAHLRPIGHQDFD